MTPDWMHAALCRHYPEIEFVPDTNANLQIAKAKAVCANCPVSRDCLEYGLEWGGAFGVFGGTDYLQRRRILRDRNRRTAA